jgi:hypothetical protein
MALSSTDELTVILKAGWQQAGNMKGLNYMLNGKELGNPPVDVPLKKNGTPLVMASSHLTVVARVALRPPDLLNINAGGNKNPGYL